MGEGATATISRGDAAVDGPGSWRPCAGVELPGGRYVLDRRLGSGGMASVWSAHDIRLDRRVAVKILAGELARDPGYVERFDREAHLAARLSQHPNLVTIYDFEAGPRPFLVMEYVGGGDLGERLGNGTAPDAASIARDLLAAVDHIHAAGIIHRDIKPGNVLIGDDGRAMLTDFGIAGPCGGSGRQASGLIFGSGRYLAPELLEGAEADERSDLYSLGVTLARVVEAAGAEEAVVELTRRLHAPDPDERPACAAIELRDLEEQLAGPAAWAPAVERARLAVDSVRGDTGPMPLRQRSRGRVYMRRLAGIAPVASISAVVIALFAGAENRSGVPAPDAADASKAVNGAEGGAKTRGGGGPSQSDRRSAPARAEARISRGWIRSFGAALAGARGGETIEVPRPILGHALDPERPAAAR